MARGEIDWPAVHAAQDADAHYRQGYCDAWEAVVQHLRAWDGFPLAEPLADVLFGHWDGPLRRWREASHGDAYEADVPPAPALRWAPDEWPPQQKD